MQVYLSKQNSQKSTSNNLATFSMVLSVVIVSATLTTMIMVPGYWSFFPGICLILLTTRYLYHAINRKPLLMEINDHEISFVSDQNNEPITIGAKDILTIHHKFCELEIHTKDNGIHTVNLLNTGSEQTRWEIKEHLKKLTEKINTVDI